MERESRRPRQARKNGSSETYATRANKNPQHENSHDKNELVKARNWVDRR
jgi:hypothetical protein